MRICIDLTSLNDNFSGIERFALSITKELIKNKTHYWILIFKNNVHKDFMEEQDNIEKIIVKGKNKLLFYQFILPIKLLKIKADRFFFPAFPAPFFFFKKKSISTIHDLSCWDCPESNKRHMILYFKVMYWKASLNNKKVVTVSEFSRKRISSILKVKNENITVIYNGISESFFEVNHNNNLLKKYGIPNKYLLCLSTIEPRKNIELLIKAFSIICEEIDIYLVLAGRNGWLSNDLYTNLSEEVRKKIIFTGFIDNDDLPLVYKNALCFIFPSLYEGFGIPPLEAMATGTPVLSSDATAMPEILGTAAIYFKSNDIESLIEKLKIIIKTNGNNSIRKKSIEQAKKYSWKKSAEKLIDFLNNS